MNKTKSDLRKSNPIISNSVFLILYLVRKSKTSLKNLENGFNNPH
ncbi:hypothetical protein LEP1GSC125_3235 [Leptospira mayottensis 200901122]|uniref:Uncharacterized protein n=1 Tax=Leptospira mayottensis 200901122 TaxID=1193010 RepID=A0AA87MPQ1_9LEPT|nr:hypothetical protein LEP1GSC125_3235 [Leptospira mayottensis 200901122]